MFTFVLFWVFRAFFERVCKQSHVLIDFSFVLCAVYAVEDSIYHMTWRFLVVLLWFWPRLFRHMSFLQLIQNLDYTKVSLYFFPSCSFPTSPKIFLRLKGKTKISWFFLLLAIIIGIISCFLQYIYNMDIIISKNKKIYLHNYRWSK